MISNEYEITSKNTFWTRSVRNFTRSLISGIWFLSPEAGGTLRPVPGEPSEAAVSKVLLRSCIRTLWRYLKVSLVKEKSLSDQAKLHKLISVSQAQPDKLS